MSRRTYAYDNELLMKDAGLVAASAAATVGGAAKVRDVGANTRVDEVLVIDVSAIEIASANEEYDIIVQGSNSASFASGIENLAQYNMGSTSVRQGGAQDSTTGRYELPYTNYQDDTTYRYLRVYTVVAGSIASGINYTAFSAPLMGK